MTATTARDGIAPTTRSLAGWPWRDRLFAAGRRCGISGRGLVVAIPYVWLLLLFAAPFVIVAKISVSQQQTALPPYTPLIQMVEEGNVKLPGQDENGIWTAPTGDKVAWFKDPDGNVLSISQHITA